MLFITSMQDSNETGNQVVAPKKLFHSHVNGYNDYVITWLLKLVHCFMPTVPDFILRAIHYELI